MSAIAGGMTRCWVVVLTWNGRTDTLELLRDLEGSVGSDDTILLVDNDSHDGTVDAVAEAHPAVEILQTGANLGFAEGNNRGLRRALGAGATHVCILNNDTRVPPGFLDPLIRTADERGAAVSPDIRYADDPDIAWFRGGTLDHRLGRPRHLSPAEMPGADHTFASPILTGCCLLAPAAVWEVVGEFDPAFFLTFEDSDWSCRARSRGVPLLVVPESRIRHKVSRSFTGTAGRLGTHYFTRNGLWFAHRWMGGRGVLAFLAGWVLRPVVRAVLGRDRVGPAGVRMRITALVAAACGAGGAAGPLVRLVAFTPRSRGDASPRPSESSSAVS